MVQRNTHGQPFPFPVYNTITPITIPPNYSELSFLACAYRQYLYCVKFSPQFCANGQFQTRTKANNEKLPQIKYSKLLTLIAANISISPEIWYRGDFGRGALEMKMRSSRWPNQIHQRLFKQFCLGLSPGAKLSFWSLSQMIPHYIWSPKYGLHNRIIINTLINNSQTNFLLVKKNIIKLN